MIDCTILMSMILVWLGLGGMHWQALAIVDGRTITHSFSKSLALSNFSDVPIMYC